MNLLELMLKEEIEWPVSAEYVVQDDDGEKVKFGRERPPTLCSTGVWYRDVEVSVALMQCLASDWSTRIITREEYQAAGGWMKWDGGTRPVSSDSIVDFIVREDVVILVGSADSLDWQHCGEESDIIAYRLINQQTVQLDTPEIEPGFESFTSVEDVIL